MIETLAKIIDELQHAASALQAASEQFRRAGMLREGQSASDAACRAVAQAEWAADELAVGV